jgi:GR25 family glycosyltransferase involved in LPS biosynthesis
MKLDQYFDRIFVINLKRRRDRLEKFFHGIAPYAIDINSIEVVEAVDGHKERPDLGPDAGKWGCAMSHKRVHELIMKSEDQKVLVFEDDCEFFDGFEEKFKSALKDLPDNWDMFYLGGNLWVPPIKFKNSVHKIIKCYSTHAYAVTQKFVRNYHHLIDFNSIIDNQYAELHSMMNAYVIHPSICGQFTSYSDVENKEVDYTNVFK